MWMSYAVQTYAASQVANIGTGSAKVRTVQSGLKQFNKESIKKQLKNRDHIHDW